MKKLKTNQLGPWCTFCPPKTRKAVFVQTGWYGQFSCDEHKEDLRKYEQDESEREQRMTEADHQSWANL